MSEENELILKKVRNVTLIFAIAFALLGILLLLIPFGIYDFLGYLLGAVAVGFGVYRLVLYFMRKKSASLLAVDLFSGVLLLAFGIVCFVMHARVAGYTAIVFGLLMIAGSIIKFQNAIDLFRLGLGRWWVILILGAVSVLLGILLLSRPNLPFLNLKDREIFLLVSGVFLLYDSASDFASAVLFAVQKRRNRKAQEEAGSSGESTSAGYGWYTEKEPESADDTAQKPDSDQTADTESKENRNSGRRETSMPDPGNTSGTGSETGNSSGFYSGSGNISGTDSGSLSISRKGTSQNTGRNSGTAAGTGRESGTSPAEEGDSSEEAIRNQKLSDADRDFKEMQ